MKIVSSDYPDQLNGITFQGSGLVGEVVGSDHQSAIVSLSLQIQSSLLSSLFSRERNIISLEAPGGGYSLIWAI